MTEDTSEMKWCIEAKLRFESRAMRDAIQGEATPGTFHFTNWIDKPHRVVFDACRLMEQAADDLAKAKEALSFYADEENWFGVYIASNKSAMADDWQQDGHPEFPDGKPGHLARTVLAQLEEPKDE